MFLYFPVYATCSQMITFQVFGRMAYRILVIFRVYCIAVDRFIEQLPFLHFAICQIKFSTLVFRTRFGVIFKDRVFSSSFVSLTWMAGASEIFCKHRAQNILQYIFQWIWGVKCLHCSPNRDMTFKLGSWPFEGKCLSWKYPAENCNLNLIKYKSTEKFVFIRKICNEIKFIWNTPIVIPTRLPTVAIGYLGKQNSI